MSVTALAILLALSEEPAEGCDVCVQTMLLVRWIVEMVKDGVVVKERLDDSMTATFCYA